MTIEDKVDCLEHSVYRDMGNNRYATRGVGTAGVTTGVIGTALGALSLLGGNGFNLGNLFGRANDAGVGNMASAAVGAMAAGLTNRCQPVCSEDHNVNRYEFDLQLSHTKEIQQKDLEIAALNTDNKLLQANTYTDQKMLDMYAYIDGRLKDINSTLCAQSVQNQANKDSFQIMQERLDCAKHELSNAIRTESQERCCADNSIVNYVNATFYPKMVADVTTGTTTTAQNVYNPLPCCNSTGCGCGRGSSKLSI